MLTCGSISGILCINGINRKAFRFRINRINQAYPGGRVFFRVRGGGTFQLPALQHGASVFYPEGRQRRGFRGHVQKQTQVSPV